MKKIFRPTSYQLANKKWVSSYMTYIQSGPHTNEQEYSWDNKYFDTKEEADKFATDFCIQKGHKPVKEK